MSKEVLETKKVELDLSSVKMCSDKDDDCKYVPDYLNCYLYATECGMCPFLTNRDK